MPKYICPNCKNSFDKLYTVHTTDNEPFTATALHAIEGLNVYGVAEKVIICQQDNFLHFKFTTDDEERLVQMLPPNFDEIDAAHERADAVSAQCEHEGCTNQGDACWGYMHELEPMGYYCDEHKYEEGFCVCCNTFNAGIESFDFGEHHHGMKGYCESCADQMKSELGEDDDYWDEEFDDYDYNELYDDF
jgi:hypothetical protein